MNTEANSLTPAARRSVAWRAARSSVALLVASGMMSFVVATVWPVGGAETAPCLASPVEGTVVDPFLEPPCIWCAGNRGIEYKVGRGVRVNAAATGRVTFSGIVVNTRYVVVETADGWLLTYGKLGRSQLERGDAVLLGTEIGSASEAFFFGLRIDGRYVDPGLFLGEEVGRPRLLPSDGTSPRPSPGSRLRCGAPVDSDSIGGADSSESAAVRSAIT